MSTYLDSLYEGYRVATKAGQDLMNRATDEGRDLTAEEEQAVDRAFGEAQYKRSEIDRLVKFQDAIQATDSYRSTAAPFISRGERSERRTPDMRTLFRMIRDNNGMGIDFPATPNSYDLRSLQSAGGSAVEVSFADFVTVYARSLTPMLDPSVVNLQTFSDGSPRVYPQVTADPSHGGTITAEAAGINELDATFASIQLNPYKFAVTNLWSSELGQDSAIPLEQTIAETTARELSIDIGAALTTGNGSTFPNGFITAAQNGGTASGTGTTAGTYFGATDLIDLFYSRSAPAREAGTWMANATTLAQIRKARDSQGQFLWTPSFAVGEPEAVLGRPIRENPAMASGSAAKAVAFGDFSKYCVQTVPVRVEGSIHYAYNTDRIALRTIFRVDGDLLDAGAIAYLVNVAV